MIDRWEKKEGTRVRWGDQRTKNKVYKTLNILIGMYLKNLFTVSKPNNKYPKLQTVFLKQIAFKNWNQHIV